MLDFHFHISHIPGKLNPIIDALLRRPQVNIITVTHYKYTTNMVNDYAHEEEFTKIDKKVEQGQVIPPCSIKDGFLIYGSRLCITKSFKDKV